MERVAQLPAEPQVEWCESLKAWVVTPADDDDLSYNNSGSHRLISPQSGKPVLKMFTIRKFGFRVARERALEWRDKRREKTLHDPAGTRRTRAAPHSTMLMDQGNPAVAAAGAAAAAVSPTYSTSTCASTPSPSASPAGATVSSAAAVVSFDPWGGVSSTNNRKCLAAHTQATAADEGPLGNFGGFVSIPNKSNNTNGSITINSSNSVEVMRSAVCHILGNLQQCISRILTSERAAAEGDQLAADIHKWSYAVYVQLDLFSSFARLGCESRHPDAEALVSEMLMPYLRLFAHCIRLNKLPSELPDEYQLLLLDALCILGSPDSVSRLEFQQQQQQEQQNRGRAGLLPDTNMGVVSSLPSTPGPIHEGSLTVAGTSKAARSASPSLVAPHA